MREWERHFPGMFDNAFAISATANIILQLANPAVGYGVKESIVHSGNVFKHPWKRTRTTLTYISVALLGTGEEKLTYRKAVGHSHQAVRSREDSPVKYNAFSTDLQLWVASCIFWGYYDLWTKMHGQPSHADAEKMLRMLEPVATTLQVKPEDWHQSLDGFNAYWEKHLNELEIDDVIRQYLTDLTEFKFLNKGFQLLFADFNRFVTAGFLPPQIRKQMHMEWSDKKQKAFDMLLRSVGLLNRITPLLIRGFSMNLFLWDLRYRIRTGKSLV
jgi:uncharacterized protein (DUF2236 family)